MKSTRPVIKVCGMRDAENIRALEEQAKPDLMGFICWEHSSRYISEVPTYLPNCPRVGVFVNPTLDDIQECSKAFGFSYIQLHGNESPDFCLQTKEITELPVIKAFNISEEADLANTALYEGAADYFLFDTKGKSVGGNGEKFNWTVLENYHGTTPFLLSGGIGPEDARQLTHWHHPQCLGFDINSRFEVAPGLKNIEAVAQFCKHIFNGQ